jgi:anaerobic nitric oxide reductase transcription regulator
MERSVPRQQDALLKIAVDLTSSLAATDRLDRLLATLREAIPCDAAAILQLVDDTLVPIAVHGLAPEVLGQRFRPSEHPRLARVLQVREPVRFCADDPLPDPFEGLLLASVAAQRGPAVHACLACPLVEGGRLVGVLTADALTVGAFDEIRDGFLHMLGALAGAALQTHRLMEALERASRHHQQVARVLQRDATHRDGGGHILGTSPVIQRLRDEIELVARTDFPVLITGETGVGKELVARSIHQQSPRGEAALIHVNCAALPESIVESELFGHLRGAFTGASADRAGKFEIADGGTLFLDEVGELPPSVQPKLLRALQEGEIQRVGSDRLLRVDVRVVAATNRDMVREVAAGRFRADLFHRLNMYPLRVPPLRERRADIPLLAGFFLDLYRTRLGVGPVRLTEAARAALFAGAWPGNVRELDHVLGRAVLRASASADRNAPIFVAREHLSLEGAMHQPPESAEKMAHAPAAPATLAEALEATKRRLILDAVAAHGGNWSAAARALGMARGNLHHMAARLGIVRTPPDVDRA